MDKNTIFTRNQIFSMKDLFSFMQKEITYGWLDKDGKKQDGVNDAFTYCLQFPEELLENKKGICWDMTELARYFFETETELEYETYYLFYDDKKGCPSHSILVFYKENKVYWFEPRFDNYSGIYEYRNLEELLSDFKKQFIKDGLKNSIIPKNYEKDSFFLYRYPKPPYHINGYQMRNHINRSILIEGK